jgi:hypothetical protein
MTRRELSQLSPEEKDALILALLARVAALEARPAAEDPLQLWPAALARPEG